MKVDGKSHQGYCTPWETVCSTHELGCWVGQRPSLDLREKLLSPAGIRTLDRPAHISVTVVTPQYQNRACLSLY